MLRFHTPGIPLSSGHGLENGLSTISELGLDGMELEFVRNVFIKREQAPQIKSLAEKLNLSFTVHASYFVNLNSDDPVKLRDSKLRILSAAERGYLCGARSCCFHPAYYGNNSREQCYSNVKKAFQEIVDSAEQKGLRINIAPETMGRVSQFGSFDELLKLCSEVSGSTVTTYPCIDFAHCHAREGKLNSREEFSGMLSKYESAFGPKGLRSMHIHLAGIAYGQKGEQKHLNLRESDMDYLSLLQVLKDFRIEGCLVCESPNVEQDTLLLKSEHSGKL